MPSLQFNHLLYRNLSIGGLFLSPYRRVKKCSVLLFTLAARCHFWWSRVPSARRPPARPINQRPVTFVTFPQEKIEIGMAVCQETATSSHKMLILIPSLLNRLRGLGIAVPSTVPYTHSFYYYYWIQTKEEEVEGSGGGVVFDWRKIREGGRRSLVTWERELLIASIWLLLFWHPRDDEEEEERVRITHCA